MVKVSALVATGINAEGYREILGVQVATGESTASWLAFFRDLLARGLIAAGPVELVTSDAHAGLVEAIGATLSGTAWQRCRTHYAANLMSTTPKSSWPWVKALLHSVYDQPDAASVHAQFDRVLEALTGKLPAVAAHLEEARADILAFTAFPKEVWRQIWSNNPNERLNREIPQERAVSMPMYEDETKYENKRKQLAKQGLTLFGSGGQLGERIAGLQPFNDRASVPSLSPLLAVVMGIEASNAQPLSLLRDYSNIDKHRAIRLAAGKLLGWQWHSVVAIPRPAGMGREEQVWDSDGC